jgi:hypothetical protein
MRFVVGLVAVVVVGFLVPAFALSRGGGDLPETQRAFGDEARRWSSLLIWDNPIERGLIRHVKVLDVIALDPATTPTCEVGVGATMANCIPPNVDLDSCLVGFEPPRIWMTAHLRAYTWMGLPYSEALVGCGGAQRL